MKAEVGNRSSNGAGLHLEGTSHRGTAAVSGQGRVQRSRMHKVVGAGDERDGEEGTGRGGCDA